MTKWSVVDGIIGVFGTGAVVAYQIRREASPSPGRFCLFGLAASSSDLINALAGAVLGIAASLSPVGNLPVVHALFKSDGLGYPGNISFCPASVIIARDIKSYVRTFGSKQAFILVRLLFGAAV